MKLNLSKHRKLIYIGASVVVALLLFAFNAQSQNVLEGKIGVLADPEFRAGFPAKWGLSTWAKNIGNYETAYDGDKVTFKVWADSLFDYYGVGAYQGSKPFDWGSAPSVFEPLRIGDAPVYLVWKGAMLNCTTGVAGQVSMGVDLWFQVDTAEGRKLAEAFIWFFQQGPLSLNTGSSSTIIRFQEDTNWFYLMYHHVQLEIGRVCEYALQLNPLVDELRKNYGESEFSIVGVDCHLELMNSEASFTVDFCQIYA